MILKVGKTKYKILEVDETSVDTDTYWNYGCIRYKEQVIEIRKDLQLWNKRRTLIHELYHAFLNEYALPQEKEITYTFERLCEVASTYADDVVKLADKYFNSKG